MDFSSQVIAEGIQTLRRLRGIGISKCSVARCQVLPVASQPPEPYSLQDKENGELFDHDDEDFESPQPPRRH